MGNLPYILPEYRDVAYFPVTYDLENRADVASFPDVVYFPENRGIPGLMSPIFLMSSIFRKIGGIRILKVDG